MEEEDVSSSLVSPDIVDFVDDCCDASPFVVSAGTITGIGSTTCISIVPKETRLLLLLLRRIHVGEPCFSCFWVWRCVEVVAVDSSSVVRVEGEDAKLAVVADDASALLALAPAADADSFKISRQLLAPALGIVGEHAGLSPKALAAPILSLEADVGRNVVVTDGSRKTNLAGVIYRRYLAREVCTSSARTNKWQRRE